VPHNRRKSAERRRARLEAERKQRARKNRRAAVTVGVAVLALVIVLVVVLTGSSGGSTVQYVTERGVDPSALPGILTTPAPWPINTKDLPARLAADGMPPLGAVEGQVLHIHQHIDIYIRGAHTLVPPYVGIRVSPDQILYAPIHTHPGEDGIIHVESPTQRDFTLGEFFDVWGVLFTPTCIGGYCNAGNEHLQVFANGKVVTGNPRQLKLTPHKEIVVTFGTPDQIPKPYPVSYNFPQGL